MSITRKKHWMFVATVIGAVALTGCTPTAQQPEAQETQSAAQPAAAEPATAEPAAAATPASPLAGLKIVDFGPKKTKVNTPFNEQANGVSAIWVKADRSLDGYEAALWLNGIRLEKPGIAGATVTGAIPPEMLAQPGNLSLEIRIGKDGAQLSSEKVNFIVE